MHIWTYYYSKDRRNSFLAPCKQSKEKHLKVLHFSVFLPFLRERRGGASFFRGEREKEATNWKSLRPQNTKSPCWKQTIQSIQSLCKNKKYASHPCVQKDFNKKDHLPFEQVKFCQQFWAMEPLEGGLFPPPKKSVDATQTHLCPFFAQ